MFNTSFKHDCLYDVIRTCRRSLLTYFLKYHRVKKKACHVCLLSHLVLSDSVILWTAAHQDPLPWRFPSETTGMGCYALLQGIFPTQGSNLRLLRLLHCRCVLYLAEPLGIHSKATYMPFEKKTTSNLKT